MNHRSYDSTILISAKEVTSSIEPEGKPINCQRNCQQLYFIGTR